jgi:excisionase family DNA binding protein
MASRGVMSPSSEGSNHDWITPEEAGKRLGVGVDVVLRLIDEEELAACHAGRGVRIRAGDVDPCLGRSRIRRGALAHLR